jgi:ABC-2 type transport system ATP-binding protein
MKVVQDICDRVVVLVDGRVVANDTVPNLLALFRAQAYRFVITGSVPSDQRIAIETRFPLSRFTSEDGRTSIDVEFADERGFFDLVRVLDRDGTVVESVEREEPDLEQVFLRLIQKVRP